MSWSYSGDPDTSDMDMVRFLVGDTDAADPLVQNEEVVAVLASQPIVSYAAAVIADTLAAKFARRADHTIGKMSMSASQQAKAYERLADRLRAGGAGDLPGGDGSGVPTVAMFVGGTSVSGNAALAQLEDAEPQSFARGMHDNSGED